ncbi:MAG: polysaccharide lyase 6 family protein [Chitinophagaceae bacterium]|nr:polysaccharide lyase 6 family protein [Chitinophagaceae bacterium]
MKKRNNPLLLTATLLLALNVGYSQRIPVKDNQELRSALSKAKPGDSIVLANGIWKDVPMLITASGTAERPVVIMAETPGGVKCTGNSFIRFGSDHVTVSGLHFSDGYAVKEAIVEFRKSDNLANNCRLTQCVFENFSKPNRSDDDHWITLWGKKNRIDHCVIGNKLNTGTTIIVELNDERSQHNEHSIDSNYFKGRQPLGSNGGETIRIGVSRYSLTSSNTLVHHNYFERCNGEVEIISVKSGNNRLTENTFYECEGGLVLRHGSGNIVLNNIFIGNNKPYTGGVRVINPGHTVANNLFIDLAGKGFHGGFTVLNGVPNSPLNRYMQVTDVEIHHNTFLNCKTILFGAGKDEERTLPPARVTFRDNFIQTTNTTVYEDANNDGGITFRDNRYSGKSVSAAPAGFASEKPTLTAVSWAGQQFKIPVVKEGADLSKLNWMSAANTGASWFKPEQVTAGKVSVYSVAAADSQQLNAIIGKANAGDIIELNEAGLYKINEPLLIRKPLVIKAKTGLAGKPQLVSISESGLAGFIILESGGSLSAERIVFNSSYENYGAVRSGISTGSQPVSAHYVLKVDGCEFINFGEGGHVCIRGAKGTYADSVLISNSIFRDNAGVGIDYGAEKDDKGIYNVAYLRISNTVFANLLSGAINVYRGGNDESTTGPSVSIDHCTFHNVENRMQGTVVKLIGVQVASITNSVFNYSGKGGRIIWFEEMAWDKLNIDYCNVFDSGRISTFFNKATGKHIIRKKPLFRDLAANDLRLAITTGFSGNDGKPMGVL